MLASHSESIRSPFRIFGIGRRCAQDAAAAIETVPCRRRWLLCYAPASLASSATTATNQGTSKFTRSLSCMRQHTRHMTYVSIRQRTQDMSIFYVNPESIPGFKKPQYDYRLDLVTVDALGSRLSIIHPSCTVLFILLLILPLILLLILFHLILHSLFPFFLFTRQCYSPPPSMWIFFRVPYPAQTRPWLQIYIYVVRLGWSQSVTELCYSNDCVRVNHRPMLSTQFDTAVKKREGVEQPHYSAPLSIHAVAM